MQRLDHNSRATHSLIIFLGVLCGLLALTWLGCKSKIDKDTIAKEKRNDHPNTPDSTYAFEDITQSAGLQSVYDNGESGQAYSILESLGGGLGAMDFDNDGRVDLCFPGGGSIDPVTKTITGRPTKLFRQRSDGLIYDEVGQFAGVAMPHTLTHGCSLADINNDGFCDMLVSGYGRLQLMLSMGDGTFIECAQAIGLTDDKWSSSTAFADINGDGTVDLYVAHYVDWSWENDPKCYAPGPERKPDVCTPPRFRGLDDALYFNDGQGGFRDESRSSGLVGEGKGLGVIAADFDDDRDVDIYVANDTTENFFYTNDGKGQLTESGIVSGTALDQRGTPNGSMGLAVLDYDGDRRPDIWVTNFENETFSMYRNQGQGNFQCVTESTGITAIGTLYVGFGTVASDVDLDGDEDLIVSNGHVQRYPGASSIAQHPLLLLSNGRGRLQKWDAGKSGYFSQPHRGRSVVNTDLNGDGLQDLIFSHVQEPAILLLNRCQPQGSWIALRLVGREANRDAIGAGVELQLGKNRLIRSVVGGGGYLSQAPYELHWGLPGAASSDRASVTIHWPNSNEQSQADLALGQRHLIVQP